MRLKMVMRLSSFRIRSVRSTSPNVEPLVVTSSMTSTFCSRIVCHSSSSAFNIFSILRSVGWAKR